MIGEKGGEVQWQMATELTQYIYLNECKVEAAGIRTLSHTNTWDVGTQRSESETMTKQPSLTFAAARRGMLVPDQDRPYRLSDSPSRVSVRVLR